MAAKSLRLFAAVVALAASAGQASAAFGDGPAAGVGLDRLRWGMSQAQIQRAYPDATQVDVEETATCEKTVVLNTRPYFLAGERVSARLSICPRGLFSVHVLGKARTRLEERHFYAFVRTRYGSDRSDEGVGSYVTLQRAGNWSFYGSDDGDRDVGFDFSVVDPEAPTIVLQ